MSWTEKYRIGDKVKYTELAGYTWDAEITEVEKSFIQLKWSRERKTHPQWNGYRHAYSINYTRMWDDRRVNCA